MNRIVQIFIKLWLRIFAFCFMHSKEDLVTLVKKCWTEVFFDKKENHHLLHQLNTFRYIKKLMVQYNIDSFAEIELAQISHQISMVESFLTNRIYEISLSYNLFDDPICDEKRLRESSHLLSYTINLQIPLENRSICFEVTNGQIINKNPVFFDLQLKDTFKICSNKIQWKILGCIIQSNRVTKILNESSPKIIQLYRSYNELNELFEYVVSKIEADKNKLWFFQGSKKEGFNKLLKSIHRKSFYLDKAFADELNHLDVEWLSYLKQKKYQDSLKGLWLDLKDGAEYLNWMNHKVNAMCQIAFNDPVRLTYFDFIGHQDQAELFEFNKINRLIQSIISKNHELDSLDHLLKRVDLTILMTNNVRYITSYNPDNFDETLIFIQKVICVIFWRGDTLGPWSREVNHKDILDLKHRITAAKGSLLMRWKVYKDIIFYVSREEYHGNYSDSDMFNLFFNINESEISELWLWYSDLFQLGIWFWVDRLLMYSIPLKKDDAFVLNELDLHFKGMLKNILLESCLDKCIWNDVLCFFHYENNFSLINLVTKIIQKEVMQNMISLPLENIPYDILSKSIIQAKDTLIDYFSSFTLHANNISQAKKIAQIYQLNILTWPQELNVHLVKINTKLEMFQLMLQRNMNHELSIYDLVLLFNKIFQKSKDSLCPNSFIYINNEISESFQFAICNNQIEQWLSYWLSHHVSTPWDLVFNETIDALVRRKSEVLYWCNHIAEDLHSALNQSLQNIRINPLIVAMIYYQLFPKKVLDQLHVLFFENKEFFNASSQLKRTVHQLSFHNGQSISLWDNLETYKLQEEKECIMSMSTNKS